MTGQTKAKRLADALDRRVPVFDRAPIVDQAAAELRRLDESEAALVEVLKGLADLYDTDDGCKSLPQYQMARTLITRIEAERTAK